MLRLFNECMVAPSVVPFSDLPEGTKQLSVKLICRGGTASIIVEEVDMDNLGRFSECETGTINRLFFIVDGEMQTS